MEDLPEEALIRLISQPPNLDYPKTAPQGGTDKGIWLKEPAAEAK